MLNIPESIKELYKTDGIRKNIRITFPSGEFPDIKNDQIVQESVKFTESIMSQNTFRFGLAEAPRIEFECVGVANILGMTIQCWHEIETTSLSAVQIEEIQSGSWDGTLVLAEDSDLGYGYFRLPLGVFTVESCPRSHGSMAHRQVKATGRAVESNAEALDPITKWKLAQWYPSKSWGINWDFLAPSIYGSDWSGMQDHYAATAVTSNRHVGPQSFPAGSIKLPGWHYNAIIWVSGAGINPIYQEAYYGNDGGLSDLVRVVRPSGFTRKALLVRLASSLYQTVFADIAAAHPDIDWDTATTEDGELLEGIGPCANYMADQILDCIDFRPYIYPWPTVISSYDNSDYHYRFGNAYGGLDMVVNASVPDEVVNEVRVPYGIYGFHISLSYHVTPDSQTASESYDCPDVIVDNTRPTLYNLTSTDADIDFPDLPLQTTLELKLEGDKYYGYTNSFSFKKLLTSFLELQGRFGKVRRDGVIELYDLAQVVTEHLTQSDVQEMWWDESNIEPIGSVKVKYKIEKSNEEQSAVIAIGPGASTYDMTDSYILTKWSTTLSAIRTTLRGRFAQRVKALTWTTTDMTVRGLPYLEAGDWVEIDTSASDIQKIGIPYLDRSMSGIQVLEDTVSSVAGDIIDIEVDDE